MRMIGSVVVAILAAATSAETLAQPNAGNLTAIYGPLAMEEGVWDADVTFYENDKPGPHVLGVQTNTLLANRHWIINDLRIPATDKTPAYQGHGVWGYDPVAKTYVNTWVDTNDLGVRIDYGFWYEAENTMVWSSKQNDGNGHFVDYRIVEQFKGDVRILTFYQLGLATPTPHPLVKIVFTRRKTSTSTPAPAK